MHLSSTEIIVVITIATLIFLLAPIFLLIYIRTYNALKIKNLEEKHNMQVEFESEMIKTQISAQKDTMQTIAAELHDNIGQLLSLTSLTLNSINIKEIEKSEKKINNSLNLLHKSIKELRDLAKLFQGEQLLEHGLGKAIQQELDRLRSISGYKIKLKNQLLEIDISSSSKDILVLRMLQEIINNIIKHSKATHIEVESYLLNKMLFLNVSDNGIGFNYEEIKQQKKGIGLNSIFKRVEVVNGTIKINSTPPNGTFITIQIPYP